MEFFIFVTRIGREREASKLRAKATSGSPSHYRRNSRVHVCARACVHIGTRELQSRDEKADTLTDAELSARFIERNGWRGREEIRKD